MDGNQTILPTEPKPQADFRVTGHLIRPMLNAIVSAKGSVHVEPRIMNVLVHLAEHPGVVVSKEQLLDHVWNGRFVCDDVLIRSICELRKALGDNAKRPRIIQTIPKRGYRLVASVERIDNSAQEDSGNPVRDGTDEECAFSTPDHEQILDALDCQVYVLDASKRFIYVNRAAQKACGCRRQALVGRTWRELSLSAALFSPLAARLTSVLSGVQEERARIRYQTPCGCRVLLYHLRPLLDRQSNVQAVVCSVRDIRPEPDSHRPRAAADADSS